MDGEADAESRTNGNSPTTSPPYAPAYARQGTPGYPDGLESPGQPRHPALPPVPVAPGVSRRVALIVGFVLGLMMIANSAVNVLVRLPGSPDRISPASVMAWMQLLLGPVVYVAAGILVGRLTGSRRAGGLAAVLAFALGYVAWVALSAHVWTGPVPLGVPLSMSLATSFTLADFALLGLVAGLLSWLLGRVGAGFTIGRYAPPVRQK